ncbi:MAG: hypothetical protein SFU99_01460 [Saprospiraceae bacterium]|nr:hypothetical protein [Saprospiraceae bacterium]
MSKLTLSRHEFLTLHKAIRTQYSADCKANGVAEPASKSKIYGYGEHSDYKNSITVFMTKHQTIKDYLDTVNKGLTRNDQGYQEINGKNLYNKFRDAENNSIDEIKLSEPYSIVYFLYIGCNDYEEFKKKYNLQKTFEIYVGYYFSFANNDIKSFEFKIAHTASDCAVEVRSFHDGYLQDPFTGGGIVKNNNLFINLINKDGIEMKIIIPTESNTIHLPTYMLGVLTTITSENFPLSVRLFLVKEDMDLTASDLNRIKSYLNFHRQILRAPNERIKTLEDLAIREVFIDDLINMRGTYWMWRYHDEDIVQIKIVIEDDFTVRIFNPLYTGTFANQIGRVSVSRHFNHSLCIGTFPIRGSARQMISFYMIDMPQGNDWKYLRGVYCTVGTPTQKPSGGNLVLYKQQADPLDIVPQVIKKDDIPQYLENYGELVPLRTMLDIKTGRHVPNGN